MLTYRFKERKHPVRLWTSLRPEEVSAQCLAVGYHLRWEVELALDELKTHLATVLHGTLHTTFRSKRPELVLQEVYALLATDNLIRQTMAEAASKRDQDPLELSFVKTLNALREGDPARKPHEVWVCGLTYGRAPSAASSVRAGWEPKRPRSGSSGRSSGPSGSPAIHECPGAGRRPPGRRKPIACRCWSRTG